MARSRLAFTAVFAVPTGRAHRGCALCTRATINGANGLPNVRDIASAAPGLIRPGRLFRGAAPVCVPIDTPDPEAMRFLHSVPCFIDLRSRDERILDAEHHVRLVCGDDFRLRERHVSLLNRRRVVIGLAKVLPPNQVRTIAAATLRAPSNARANITTRMDEGGLLLLNRILIEAGGRALSRVLSIITQSVECASKSLALGNGAATAVDDADAGQLDLTARSSLAPAVAFETAAMAPVYMFCSAGKDRTGLVAALVLSVLGASHSAIIHDYVKSAETWENGPYHLRADYCGTFYLRVGHPYSPAIVVAERTVGD